MLLQVLEVQAPLRVLEFQEMSLSVLVAQQKEA